MTNSDNESRDHARPASDRAEIADTLYRYAAGLDHADAGLLGSAFTDDIMLDFTPAGSKVGMPFPVLTSKEAVVQALLAAIGPLDTSHTVSNPRTTVDGDTATLDAQVMAQHYPPGQGSRADVTAHALFMNRCKADLVRDGATWRMRRLVIDNVWFEGDLTVFAAAATPG